MYLVASSKTIQELAERMPINEEQLLLIGGFGPARVAAFGDTFLSLIRDYRAEQGISTGSDEDYFSSPKAKNKKEKKLKKEKKIPTAEVTLKFFREGKTLSDIALIRNLKLNTVSQHLEPFVRLGEIRIDEVVSEPRRKCIEEALQKANYEEGFTAVKEMLPSDYTYEEIRFVQAHRLRD